MVNIASQSSGTTFYEVTARRHAIQAHIIRGGIVYAG
jgi:hypothetical protein